jgi:hypothetical protein
MATQNTSIKQVFVSHATQDAEFAHRLAGDLQRLGIPVWIAPNSIRPGESWVDAIERGLGESSHMLVVLTPAALKSPWVKKEADVAIALERQGRMEIIPLEVRPCDVPLLLSSYQMVSFQRDYDDGFGQLASILGSRVAQREKDLSSATRQHGLSLDVIRPAATERQDPYAEQGETINRLLFEDDFQHGLGAWTIRNGQLPETDRRGLRLTNFDNDLSKMVILKGYLFADGVIECEVNLEQGALFDVIFWANLGGNPPESDEFYLARFDTRANKPEARDGILFKAAGKGQWWKFCHEHTKHNSPSGQWLTMRIEASGSHIALFCGEQLIDQIADAVQVDGSIALLAEIQDVHVRRIRIKPR